MLFILGGQFWGPGCNLATAKQVAYRTYGVPEGLSNGWSSCLKQGPSGYLFTCTEHGLYIYDGRRFFNLGPNQGLPDGGIAIDVVFTTSSRLIIRYPHEIYVSTNAIIPGVSPIALRFQKARSEIGQIPDGGPGQMVPWKDGAVFNGRGRLDVVQWPDGTVPPVVTRADGFLNSTGPLNASTAIAVSDSTLWATREDGSICGFDARSTRCYGPADGLPADQWTALLPTDGGHLFARSRDRLADIDISIGHASVLPLPNQAGRYDNYSSSLLLALTPSGKIVTQSADGLIILGKSGWQALTTQDGLPPSPILRLMFDHQGGLWLGVLGQGVMRALGYNAWENYDHHDGLSSDVVWQVVRQPNGPLWVASDAGVDALDAGSAVAPVKQHHDQAGFALAYDGLGHLWRSVGSNAVARITVATGAVVQYPIARVSQILRGRGNRLWFTTEKGLYVVDDASMPPPSGPQPVPGLPEKIDTAAVSPDGSLWGLHGRTLLHRHPDGQVVLIRPNWQQAEFDPITLTAAPNGALWVAGAGGGLYRLQMDGDRIVSSSRFQPPEIISNTIVSLLVDSRGWLWAGTDRGVSAFNGRRWVSATTSIGLVWDDQDQDGLMEDADGSMWFATSRGLSHLIDPGQLFRRTDPHPVITAVTVGDADYQGLAIPHTQEPFIIQFGALDFNADGVIRFRYRLQGVDQGWADTASGFARYASVPSGHHRFELVAYNPLTHVVSAPVSVLLRIRKPWWLWWPVLVLYGVATLAVGYSALHIRFRFLVGQRRKLQREVDLRTAEIRQAQATDSLTGLLTRGEIQSRLVTALAGADRTTRITIGLLDIDHFKRINDRFGHLAGDDILEEIGLRMRSGLEPGDYAGRYGGEEILIVLKGEMTMGLYRIGHLSRLVSGKPFQTGGQSIEVRCSIGVAYDQLSDDWKSLIGRADKALYEAKAAGRDRIVVAPPAT